MPVTTRIITADSGSSRSVNPAVKSPEVIQVNTWLAIARDSGSSETRRITAASATTNDPSMAPQATPPAAALLTRRPTLAFTRKPRKGKSGIRSSIRSQPRRHKNTKPDQPILRVFETSWRRWLPFQRRPAIRVQRLAVAEQADHDREPDGGFRGRDRHHEEHDDLAVGRCPRAAECDERQVHCVQHDLDREQDRDQVAPHEHAGGADPEQDRRQNEIVVERHHQRCSSRRASTTAPTIATRIKIDVTSNGNA